MSNNQDRLVFYIDPMSYNNMAIYDYELITKIEGFEIVFFGNEKYNLTEPKINKIFNYSDKKGFQKLFSYIVSMLKISKDAIKYKPRIIHIQWLRVPLIEIVVYFVVKKLSRTSIILTAHNISPHDKGKLAVVISYLWYLFVDYIIVHNEKTRNELIKTIRNLEEKIIVVPHGVIVLPEPSSLEDIDNRLRRVERSKNGNVIVIGFLGVLGKYKGIDILLEAWINEKQLNQNEHVILLVAGRGDVSKFDKLKRFNNVVLVIKELSDEEFSYCLNNIDLLVMPYLKISHSGLLSTAIATNTPVIVSNIEPLKDIVDKHKIGFTVPFNNSAALSKCIVEILKDKEVLEQIKQNGDWEMADKSANWVDAAKKTENIYKEIVEHVS